MNLIELDRALRQFRLGGVTAVLETRLRLAKTEAMAPIDLISRLVADELTRRSHRLLERRRKQAEFRDPQKTLDNFDFPSTLSEHPSAHFSGFLAPSQRAVNYYY